MANIKPGYCPPFTKSVDGKCVYYNEVVNADRSSENKIYDYNGDDASSQLYDSGGTFQISEDCDLQPKTFQDNIELFHACEEWYLQPTNNLDKPDQTNFDKCMSDISQDAIQ